VGHTPEDGNTGINKLPDKFMPTYCQILCGVKWDISPMDDPFYGNTGINKLSDKFMPTYCQILHGVKWDIPPTNNQCYRNMGLNKLPDKLYKITEVVSLYTGGDIVQTFKEQ
jgi:hypothetical protein